MYNFYFNILNSDEPRHAVHKKKCSYLQKDGNYNYIGRHKDCQEAIKEAKKKHPEKDFEECPSCSK